MWKKRIEDMDKFRALCHEYAGRGEEVAGGAGDSGRGDLGARGFASSFLFLERYRYLSDMTMQVVSLVLLFVRLGLRA